MSNKKILILGGNTAQVPLIQAAKNEGYIVVLCDYTTTNPGIPLADIHYQQDFMDREAVLAIAKKEKINGVISNSEPAMQIVAYVSEQMNLVGNTEESILMLRDKGQFRDLLNRVGAFCPKHFTTSTFADATEKAKELHFPIVIKPSRSSGSRGTTIVKNLEEWERIEVLWQECSAYSENKKVVIEEYIEMPSLDCVIDGDVFVTGDRVLYNGLFTSKRSAAAPNIPMTQIYPVMLDLRDLSKFENTLNKLFRETGIQHGEYNVEAYYNCQHDLFFIEINVRQGGNGIPEMIQKHSGVDMYKLLVTTVMNENYYLDTITNGAIENNFVLRQPVFNHVKGVYKRLFISQEAIPYVKAIQEKKRSGVRIEIAKDARDCLALVDMEFTNREQQRKCADVIESMVYPIVEECNEGEL